MWSSLKPERKSAPAARILSRADALEHIRESSGVQDDYIDSLILEVEDYFDGYDGAAGKCLITQTWEEKFPIFASKMGLRLGPVQSIEQITYYDAAGTEQTVSSDVYRLHSASDASYIVEVDGQSWPNTATRDDAVTIRYVCGYGDAAADVPPKLIRAVKLLIGHWEQNRSASSEKSQKEIPFAIKSLINPYRVRVY